MMSGPEASSYTVIKKLQVRKMIKEVALKLIITINRNHKLDYDSEFKRFSRIKSLINTFRDLRRLYKRIGEVNIYDEFSRTFSGMSSYILDIKEMVMDLMDEDQSDTFKTNTNTESSEFNVNDPNILLSKFGNTKTSPNNPNNKDRLKKGSIISNPNKLGNNLLQIPNSASRRYSECPNTNYCYDAENNPMNTNSERFIRRRSSRLGSRIESASNLEEITSKENVTSREKLDLRLDVSHVSESIKESNSNSPKLIKQGTTNYVITPSESKLSNQYESTKPSS